MNLLERWNNIKNRKRSELQPGYVDVIFEIHNNNASDESGTLPIFIKPIIEEKKKKHFSN